MFPRFNQLISGNTISFSISSFLMSEKHILFSFSSFFIKNKSPESLKIILKFHIELFSLLNKSIDAIFKTFQQICSFTTVYYITLYPLLSKHFYKNVAKNMIKLKKIKIN